MAVVANRLRGETALFDIKDNNGEIIVEAGRRITAKHVRQLEKTGLTLMEVPHEYVVGRVLAQNYADRSTGEIIAEANAELTLELLAKLAKAGYDSFKTLYINDLDQGAYISETIRIDPSNNRMEALVEIYRMMRPGEPPTREAAETLFQNLFFSEDRYDLSTVGRMKFNRRVELRRR